MPRYKVTLTTNKGPRVITWEGEARTPYRAETIAAQLYADTRTPGELIAELRTVALADDGEPAAPRTCENCAHNGSPTAPCGLCVGPTATLTRWQPVRVLQQNNDAK